MPIACLSIDHAHLSSLATGGPYRARSASDNTEEWPLWYVCGPDGRRNVLSFSPPFYGAVLTSKDVALAIAEKFNQEEPL